MPESYALKVNRSLPDPLLRSTLGLAPTLTHLGASADLMFEPLISRVESFIHSHLQSSSTGLPTNFPNVEMPQFLYGDRLRWLSDGEASDWGIVIGRFYSFAPHRCCWRWCYLIWLDPDSPSAAWVTADIAWEDDLEPLEAEATS